MKTLDHIAYDIMPVALGMLPPKMQAPEAQAMLLSIGSQESGFKHRVQVQGPARGFWQFEEGGGVAGVLEHPATRPIILPILETLCYKDKSLDCYVALANNDVLACVFARLFLWQHPQPLPWRDNQKGAWNYYLQQWKPGKPHPDIWPALFARAWQIVDAK